MSRKNFLAASAAAELRRGDTQTSRFHHFARSWRKFPDGNAGPSSLQLQLGAVKAEFVVQGARLAGSSNGAPHSYAALARASCMLPTITPTKAGRYDWRIA